VTSEPIERNETNEACRGPRPSREPIVLLLVGLAALVASITDLDQSISPRAVPFSHLSRRSC